MQRLRNFIACLNSQSCYVEELGIKLKPVGCLTIIIFYKGRRAYGILFALVRIQSSLQVSSVQVS